MTRLDIFADYFQIYVCDPAHDEDWADLWTDRTVAERIVATPHAVVFGSGRNMIVAVDVIVHDREPTLDWAAADHAVTAGLTCSSGTLKVAGCTDYLPDAHAITVRAGPVGVAFLSFGLGTIDPVDGLDGNDRYELHLWPATAIAAPSVMTQWKP